MRERNREKLGRICRDEDAARRVPHCQYVSRLPSLSCSTPLPGFAVESDQTAWSWLPTSRRGPVSGSPPPAAGAGSAAVAISRGLFAKDKSDRYCYRTTAVSAVQLLVAHDIGKHHLACCASFLCGKNRLAHDRHCREPSAASCHHVSPTRCCCAGTSLRISSAHHLMTRVTRSCVQQKISLQ